MAYPHARRQLRALPALAALIAGLLLAGPAQAGRSCEHKPMATQTLVRGIELAQRTTRFLDASGEQVVVIARVGQDLRRHGLHYSHLGYALRETPGGPWRVVHKLNQCGTDRAALYRQGLGQFFLDDLFAFEAGIVRLSPELQAALLPVLRDPQRAARLHTPAYNMLAYPWAQRYQQSNQWAVETLAMAADPGARTRERAQAWLRLKDYEPSELRIGTLTRLGGRISAANIAFDDHPNGQRYAGRIHTVTVDSVFAWLERSGLGGRVEVVR
ncbi:DUF2145 domain-containing protein [Aquabacterium sp. A7-Y]|uniref:DUF2145 domain-containing protein n=1 Tax=Aquabacterium sp. A7-Y TaxID=1349605 RepID=UPI00223D8FA1|nr:DUF2145 domain-containing protein [Aquabacterium sp. A7-Y]MCW7539991.1 DUF2145 domain-containing protein [Aquabacterium sp. A7-Y]